jgi:carboxyl-terminal processing protease
MITPSTAYGPEGSSCAWRNGIVTGPSETVAIPANQSRNPLSYFLVSILRRVLLGASVLALLAVSFGAGVSIEQSDPQLFTWLPVFPGTADRASVNQVYQLIRSDYYDPRVTSRKLSGTSINAMVSSLGDPYSRYLDPQQYHQQQAFYAGRYTGMVGVYVTFQGGYPVITGLLPGSPAVPAGLEAGDVILRVGNTDLHGLSPDRASALIRGPVGSQVTLTISRGGVEREVTVTRGSFRSPTVESTRLAGDILYLRIYDFGDSTAREFDQHLKAGLPGARGVILDLRGNGGGYVEAAVAVVSRFVSSGEVMEQRGREGETIRTDVSGDHPAPHIPLVVLVNSDTASAAEIVAGSLQAHHRARLVGTKTFGKGSVQEDYPLANGGDLHLTVAHWYLPNGQSIQGRGLTPDVSVTLPEPQDMFDVVQPQLGYGADTQLLQALELLQRGQ